MTALKPRRPPQTTACSRKPASRIFQGISWNVLRPDFGFAKRVGWSDMTNPLFERLPPRERSLALAASQQVALIDAVICPSCEWRKFQCS